MMPAIGMSRNHSHDQAKLPLNPVMKNSATARNGTSATPLVVHAYDLGARGLKIVGLTR